MFPYRICGNRKLLANNRWTRVRYRYNQCFRLPIFASRATNGKQKLCFFTIFGLRSSIILTFSIAAYLVWIRCTFHDATVDIFCIQLNKIIWDCLCLKGRYITMNILFHILTFAKPECDNVLQPSPLRGSGCNTWSHSGLANVNIRKRMFYPLIKA